MCLWSRIASMGFPRKLMPFAARWWQIPISETSAVIAACLSVASDLPDELRCPVLFCNPPEPACLLSSPLYTHTQTNKTAAPLFCQLWKSTCFHSLSLCLIYTQAQGNGTHTDQLTQENRLQLYLIVIIRETNIIQGIYKVFYFTCISTYR